MRAFEFKSKKKKIKNDRLPVKTASIPVRTISMGEFEFKFAFVRFRPVTGLTGPVSRNRRAAVRGDRSDILTLLVARGCNARLRRG